MNAKYEGKTAVHAAIEDGRIDALKVLLEFKANLELAVSTCKGFVHIQFSMHARLSHYVSFSNKNGEGEKPLQGCAFL